MLVIFIQFGPANTDVDEICSFVYRSSCACRGLPPQRLTNPSSPAAPTLWSWILWSSPLLLLGCSPNGPSPKGKVSIPLPRPPLTPTSRAVKPTTRSQRACCSWQRARAKRGRRRRRRRAKVGAHRRQVGTGEQEAVDGFAFSLIIHCPTVTPQVFSLWFCQGLFRLEARCLLVI